ncbi:MAG: glycosyltransferase, partial [Sphingobacteriaceae bacterium]|nr:glycosyltransferase [Cytophagaceae bacterium]
MPVFAKKGLPTTALSVIIPARNEADNLPALLADLATQTYPNFEVIVADDSSSDGTAELAEGFDAPFRLRVLRLRDELTSSPKKRAICQALHLANGPLIVTTDGDCRVGPDWLRSLAQFHEHTGA